MMETLYEIRSASGFCRLVDFYEEPKAVITELVNSGRFRDGELFVTVVVTE